MKKYEFNVNDGVFTLHDPYTNKSWSNFLFNDIGYVMQITHEGKTYSRHVDENAVQTVLNFMETSYLYVRDDENGEYWNPSGYPALNKVDEYRCEHGQQYTRISSKRNGIYTSVTYAIAKDDTREVWAVELRNESQKTRTVSLYATTAFDLNGYEQPIYYSTWTTSYTEFLRDCNAIINRNFNPYRPSDRTSGYIMSSESVVEYEGCIEWFIGNMGSETKPYVLEKNLSLSGSMATVRKRGGVLRNTLVLQAGETKTVYFVLGLCDSHEGLKTVKTNVNEDCARIIAEAIAGKEKFGHLRTVCPEERINRLLNFWAEHQVSYCMIGKKAVRDNAQLGMAMLDFNIALAKKTIDECICHQCSDGHAVLTWYPYLEKNVYSDPVAWLVYAVCEYIKETGDFAYLNEEFPFLEGEKASVREHLKRAVVWYQREDNYGVNGLPRIYLADWNDALNIPDEKAESVFLAMQICKMYEELARLFEHDGDNGYVKGLLEEKQRLANKVNAVAFNGDYYVRAFSKYGIVGDKDAENGGKIYVNPQSWSILSGICPEEYLDKVLASIDAMETEEGVPLCAPPYQTYDERVGRMSGMLPGVYENGGIYNHAGCFKVMADCKLGRGERAVNTLLKIIPDGEKNPSSHTTCEPYVFTNCYLKHPTVDMLVGTSWQTGSSAWGLMAYYEGILGLQRDYDGLRIRPALPKTWKSVHATRIYRGNTLQIEYINNGGNTVSLMVDGRRIEGNVVPCFNDDREHTIKVTIE